jgi:cytochrome bd-type quinol oxidase subunit 2
VTAIWGVVLAGIGVVCAFMAWAFATHGGYDSHFGLCSVVAFLAFAGAVFLVIKTNREHHKNMSTVSSWVYIFVAVVFVIAVIFSFVILFRGLSGG